MANKPSEAQVLELIKQYTKQFDYIVSAVQLYWGFRKRMDVLQDQFNKAYSARNLTEMNKALAERKKISDNIYKYSVNAIIPAYSNWYKFGLTLNDAGIKVPYFGISKMFEPEYLPKMLEFQTALHAAKIQQNISGEQGTGVIPLIIWAIVAIVAFYTTEQIVNQINSSTAQQKDLVEATNQLCKDQGLSTEDCKKLLSEQQETIKTSDADKGGGLFGGFQNLLFWGVGIWGFTQFILPELKKSKT